MKTFYYIHLLFTMIFIIIGARGIPAEPIQAVLIEGTILDGGVPGFLPNEIPTLRGRYRLSDGKVISVHATTEFLVFNPDLWSPAKYGVLRGNETVSANGTRVFAFSRHFDMQEGLSRQRDWHFLCSFPVGLEEAACARFAIAFLDRVSFYFQSAKRQADLSFPATL